MKFRKHLRWHQRDKQNALLVRRALAAFVAKYQTNPLPQYIKNRQVTTANMLWPVLRKLGFRKILIDNYSISPIVFIHEKLRIIVKSNYLRDNRARPEAMIPTYFLNMQRCSDKHVWSEPILIQPLARTVPHGSSCLGDHIANFIYRGFSNIHKQKEYDLHWSNVGIYRGFATVFDW